MLLIFVPLAIHIIVSLILKKNNFIQISLFYEVSPANHLKL